MEQYLRIIDEDGKLTATFWILTVAIVFGLYLVIMNIAKEGEKAEPNPPTDDQATQAASPTPIKKRTPKEASVPENK